MHTEYPPSFAPKILIETLNLSLCFLKYVFIALYSGNAKKHSLKMKRPFLSSVCEMYLLILLTVKNFVSDILIGLGCNDTVVFKIWCFFKDTTMLDFEEIFGTKSYILILSLLSQMMLYMLK